MPKTMDFGEFVYSVDKIQPEFETYGDLYAVFKLAAGAVCRRNPSEYLCALCTERRSGRHDSIALDTPNRARIPVALGES